MFTTDIVFINCNIPCSAPDRSRLRLVAACGLLKLAQCSNYKELISPDQFLRLALTMQVRCPHARIPYLTIVAVYLSW